MSTNISADHRAAFEALTSGDDANFALFSCPRRAREMDTAVHSLRLQYRSERGLGLPRGEPQLRYEVAQAHEMRM